MCDVTSNACVPVNGLPFVEQIAWKAQHPVSGEPQHSVWTHAANKLEAKIDYSLGFDVNAWLKFWGKKFKFHEMESWYWNLANVGKFQYALGLSADYDNSCSPDAGKVTRHQPTGLSRARWVQSGTTTSTRLIDRCLKTLPRSVTVEENMPEQPDGKTVAGGLTETFNWSKEFSQNIWDEYNDDICIQGKPWMQWFIEGNEGGAPDIGVLINGTVAGNFSDSGNSIEKEIVIQSGCLKPASPAAEEIWKITGWATDATGYQYMDIYSFLIDPDGPVEPWNIADRVTSSPFFQTWYNEVQACLTQFMASGAVTIGVEAKPCPSADAEPFNAVNDNEVKPTIREHTGKPGRLPNSPFPKRKRQ